MKTIKLIGQKRFEVSLMEAESGQYIIHTKSNGVDTLSGPYDDYITAEKVFQERLLALQGN